MVTKIKGTKGSHGANGANPTVGGNGEDKSFSQNGQIGLDSMSYEVTGGAGGVGGNANSGNGKAGGNGGNANITLNGNIFNNPATTNLTVSMKAQGGDGGVGGNGVMQGPQGNGGNATVSVNGNIIQPNKPAMGTITLEAIAIGGQGTKDGNASATLNGNVVQVTKANAVNLTAAASSNDANDSTLHDGDANYGTKTATLSGNIVQGNITNVTLKSDAQYSNGTATLSGNIVQTSATSGAVILESTGQHITIENNKVTVGAGQEIDLVINQLDPDYDTLIKGNEFTGAGAGMGNTFVFTDNGFSGTGTPSLSPTPDSIVIDLMNNSFMFNGKNNKIKDIDNVTVQGNNDPTLIGNNNANILTAGGADDFLYGNGGNDTLNGSGGNDLLNGGTGNDTIDGGAGTFDTAEYSGSFSQYSVAFGAPGNMTGTVTDNTPARDGTDQVTNVEFLKFSDGLYDVTTQTFIPNTAVNHAPAGTDHTVVTNEDNAYTFTVSDFGFTDPGDAPDNNFVAVTITTIPAGGVLKDNGVTVNAGDTVLVSHISANQLVFTPNANFNGSPTFTFQVKDDGGTAGGGIDTDQSPNTMTITVNAVNDAPAGTNKTLAINEDAPYTFTTSDFGFSDPNDTPPNSFLAVKITTLPANGSLKLDGVAVTLGQPVSAADIAANKLVFTPAANANGAGYGNFTFQVQDNGTTANGGVDLDQSPNTMTINVTSVNDAPAGTNNAISMAQAAPHTFTLGEFGFTDPNDTPNNGFLAVKITTLPANGSLTLDGVPVTLGQPISAADIAANKLVFTASGAGAGYGNFTFQVQDDGTTANGGVDLDPTPNSFVINVTNTLNHAPAGADKTIAMNEDGNYVFTGSDFGFNDSGDAPPNNFAGVTITTLPANGTLFNGPTQVLPGETISIGDINSGLLHFVPDANDNGAGYGNFTFQVKDDGGTAGGGIDTDQSANIMTINVASVNDAPAGANKTLAINEDAPYTFTTSDFGFSDPNDTPADSFLAVKITTLPANGSLTLDGVPVTLGQPVSAADIAANKLVFTPAANANGAGYGNFTFQVQDNGGTALGGVDLDQSANTMTINVASVNDAPAGTNNTLAILEDGAHTFTTGEFGFSDLNDTPNNGFMAVKITTLPANGSLTLDGVPVTLGQPVSAADIAANKLVFTPAANANGAGYGNFTFQVQDNGTTANGGIDLDPTPNTMTINVTSVNDAPAGTDNTLSISSNTNHVFTASEFGFTDPNDAPINNFASVIITTTPANGSLMNGVNPVNPGDTVTVADIMAGNLVFTPAPNAFGTGYGNFTFQVQDDGGLANGGANTDPSANTMAIDVSPAIIVGNQPGDYATIQAAVDAANPGDTILIRAGVYHENVTINTAGLTLQALSGPGTVILEGDFSNVNGFANVDGAQSGMATWLKTAPGYTGTGNGITVGANNVTLKDLTVNDFYSAVTVSGPLVSGLNIDGVTMQSSMFGFQKLATTGLDGTTINNSTFTDGYIGAAFLNDIGDGSGLDANNTTITNSNFSNIDTKGVYMETAQGDTLMDNITMNNVGQYGSVPSWGANGRNGNGINLNLKYHTYTGDMTISNFHLTDTGASNGQGVPTGPGPVPPANQSGAIVIAGRDDAPGYSGTPADVSGLNVVIENGTVDGTTSTAIRTGENKLNPAQNDTGPAVTVNNVTITGATVSEIDNHTASLMTVNGTAGNDLIRSAQFVGSTGSVSLFGLGGDDTLQGALGDDILNGGQGNDTLIATQGSDILNGGGNNDTADFSAATGGINLSLGITTFQNLGDFGQTKITNVENLIGTGFADVLTGEAGNNTITAGNGDDVLVATTGKDTLDGGLGNDTADFSGFNTGVIVSATATGFQTFNGTNQVKLISIENLTGGTGDDSLTGNASNNILLGGDGADVLKGNGGTLDIYNGGAGDDTITGTNGSTTDVAYFSGLNTDYTITGTLGANNVHVAGPDAVTFDTLNRVERVKFLSPADVSDVDNNGAGDLVFQDSATGAIIVANHPGGAMSSLTGSPTSNWNVVGTGQFTPDAAGNNARKAGILLQDTGTKDMQLMINISGTSSTTVALSAAPGTFTGFTALATGDYNGDAASDILMWNGATKTAEIVFLNQNVGDAVGTVSTITTVTGGPSGGNWAPVASGDFNGDGKSDILWQNGVGGAVEVTLMNGANVVNTDTVALNTSPGYTAVATGDFDKDGKSDILFATGGPGSSAEIWTMNGDSMSNSFVLNAPTTGANGAGTFTLKGAEDVNGDGYSDLLWQNTVNGDVVVQQMTAGNTALPSANLTAPTSNFHLVASSGGG